MIVVVDACQTLIVKRGWVAYDVSDFGEFRVGSDGLDPTSLIWEASSNYPTNKGLDVRGGGGILVRSKDHGV